MVKFSLSLSLTQDFKFKLFHKTDTNKFQKNKDASPNDDAENAEELNENDDTNELASINTEDGTMEENGLEKDIVNES